jgi:DNA ligase-1
VRAGVFGAYLLAVYDDEGETYQTISKLGTGFSEEQLTALADSLRPAIIPKPRSYYKVCGSAADVLFMLVCHRRWLGCWLAISMRLQAADGIVCFPAAPC